jgi:hypothetical protein
VWGGARGRGGSGGGLGRRRGGRKRELDEIIRALDDGRNELLDLEELEESELDTIRMEYGDLARQARGEPTAKRDPGGGR